MNNIHYDKIFEGFIKFEDRSDFTPCYTPVEMFKLGIFGGTYFKIETNLPEQFIKDTKSLLISESKYSKNNNRYGVVSGASLEWWLEKNLINSADPNGWVEWYVKFYYGRRHSDDSRQIQRFKSFITRHLAMLRRFETNGKDSVKTKQNLLQWAWDYKINPNW
jgi:hypothetical protein